MKYEDVVIEEFQTWTFIQECPSCHQNHEYTMAYPEICPNCGFNFSEYNENNRRQYRMIIENNPHCQLSYDVNRASELGIALSPQEQMEVLGYTLFDSTYHSEVNYWWFTVDRFIEPLPPYLHKIKYDIKESQ